MTDKSEPRSIMDISHDADMLNGLAYAAGHLLNECDDDPKARGALIALLSELEDKSEKLAKDIDRLTIARSSAAA